MKKQSSKPAPSSKAAIDRPPKPRPDFPLCPANNGYWQKKINGKVYYFGRWGKVVNGKLERLPGDGAREALELYTTQRDDLYAGRTPRTSGEGLTVGELRGRFLTAKSRALDAGEIGSRMYTEYKDTTNRLVSAFGENRRVDDLAADDFARLRATLAERFGHVRMVNEITKSKTVFKWAYNSGLIDNPVRYGPDFNKPSASVLRKHRAQNGEKMLEADELRRLLDAAPVPLKAMLLLGVNAGFGNADCAKLPLTALDLDAGWVRFPRPKTGVDRRCPLWPETVAALREAIAQRPAPKNEEAGGLVFLTERGRPWLSGGIANPISVAVRALMKSVGVHRKGFGPYTLRHVFETIGGDSRDQVAVDAIMGHAPRRSDMGATYRERIEDERLLAVTEHVRKWLFGTSPDEGGKQDEPEPAETADTIPIERDEGDDRPTLRLFVG